VTQNEVRNTGKSLCFSQNINLYLLFSVIHPDEYEKRIIRFLFDKVFIDSKQTLDELLASPILPDNLLQSQQSNEQSEPFEMLQTTDFLQPITSQPLTTTTTTQIEEMFAESTSL
jgi:hypothetical protein